MSSLSMPSVRNLWDLLDFMILHCDGLSFFYDLAVVVIVGMMPPSKRAAFDALSAAFATLSTTATTGAPTQPAYAEQAAQPTRRLYRLAHTVKSTKEAETKTALVRTAFNDLGAFLCFIFTSHNNLSTLCSCATPNPTGQDRGYQAEAQTHYRGEQGGEV
jgi:hypothetical protein